MENEKGKNVVIVLLVAIVAILGTLLVLALTGHLNLKNEEPNSNLNSGESQEPNNNEESFEYANWMNYLLEADIQEITVSRGRNVLFGDNTDYEKTITLTKEQLKNKFTELINYNLKKYYQDGMGGPNKDSMKISYSVNDVNYSFQVLYGRVIIIDTLDSELLNILNSNNYETVNEDKKELYNSRYIFAFDNSIFPVFDEYFEVK